MKKIISNIYDKISSETDNIRLVFPENDVRIKQAKKELKKLGFHLIELSDYDNKKDLFFDNAKKLKFSKNWPDNKLKDYLNNPLNHGINILKSGFADALIAGASLPTADIARSSL